MHHGLYHGRCTAGIGARNSFVETLRRLASTADQAPLQRRGGGAVEYILSVGGEAASRAYFSAASSLSPVEELSPLERDA